MVETIQQQLRKPVPLALAGIAVLGWVLLLIALSSRGTIRDNYEAQVATLTEERDTIVFAREQTAARLVAVEEAVGTAEQLNAVIVASRREVDALRGEIEGLASAREEAAVDLQRIAGLIEAAGTDFDTLTAEIERLRAERDATIATLEAARTEIAALERREVERAADLAAVGERIEEARATEAGLRATVAELTDTSARLANETAEVESVLQGMREEEAELRASAFATEERIGALLTDEQRLQSLVAELEERQADLAGDVRDAEQQRADLQDEITGLAATLAERGRDLLELEQRIAEAQDRSVAVTVPQPGTAPSTDGTTTAVMDPADPIAPGRYRSVARGRRGDIAVIATFTPNGSFRFEASGRAAEGRYGFENGHLILRDATGDVGTTRFPMRCQVEPQGEAFALNAVGNDCSMLDGLAFTPAG